MDEHQLPRFDRRRFDHERAVYRIRLFTAIAGLIMLLFFIVATTRAFGQEINSMKTSAYDAVKDAVSNAIQDKDIEALKLQIRELQQSQATQHAQLDARISSIEADRNTAKGFVIGFSALNILAIFAQVYVVRKGTKQRPLKANGRWQEEEM